MHICAASPSHRTGFTLIEILMAMAILVIGMVGVMGLYAVAVDAHRQAMDNAGVALLAQNLLSEVTADFTSRDVNAADFDNTATLTDSFIDLCCRYKKITDVKADGKLNGNEVFINDDEVYIWEEGVDAPNSPGFRCEVSIYPLPRRLWLELDAVGSTPVPDYVTVKLAERFDDDDAAARAEQEYQFDVWMLDNYWENGAPIKKAKYTELKALLSQALEYKLVVRVIRGEGDDKDIDTFRTIILPRSVVDQTQ